MKEKLLETYSMVEDDLSYGRPMSHHTRSPLVSKTDTRKERAPPIGKTVDFYW